MNTLKDYYEEFSLLPNAVKMFIAGALVLTLGFGIYSGISSSISKVKISRLEKQNSELNTQAQNSMEKATRAETNAANEALRADSLETQVKTLQAKGNLQDEKIITQTQKSADLRGNLNRVRSSQPANTSTSELERRLKARYGQTGNN